MKVWVVRDLEPIPGDPEDRRLLRTNMLCQALSAAGHDVTWYTSTFEHYLKRQRDTRDHRLEVAPGFAIEVLVCRGYDRNVSLRRILHNRQFAARFRQRFASAAGRPDVLVTDIPTIETAATVVGLARAAGIPSVLSVRDIWPDSFPDLLPRPIRPAAAPFIAVLMHQARFALRHATSVIGISDEYLDWGLRKAGRRQGPLDGVVPLGYVPAELPEATAAELLAGLGLTDPAFTVAFVGSWGKSTDMDLVAAIAEACLSRPHMRFVVGGSADGSPAAAKLQRLTNVRLTGWLGDRQIAAVLGASSLGLLPYRAQAPQGLPNKVFEYLAYGVYQLSTLGGELASFYRETGAGEVIAPPTAVAFAEAIFAHEHGSGRRAARPQLRQTFADRYAAAHLYTSFARHIETVARASLP